MGRVAGFEVDISHRPGFFEAAGVPDFLVSDSSVTTLMFNGLFRLPVGEGLYFRDLQDLEGESEFFSLGNDKLDFWRATVGVAFRF